MRCRKIIWFLWPISTGCRLPDASFDCVICSEVLEHIPITKMRLKNWIGILKPQGTLVVSVPRYFAERICWFISRDYYNEEGGHIRIYKKKHLHKMLMKQGFKCWKINYSMLFIRLIGG